VHLHDETVFWAPSIDVYRLEDRWIIYAELPGVSLEDLEVVVGPTYVRVSGRKRLPMRGVSPRSLEIDTGRFSREVELQGRIDTGRAWAHLSDGLLRVEAMALHGGKVRIPIAQDSAERELHPDRRVQSPSEDGSSEEQLSKDTDD
jgi:HSP20 family molecular chaperone IbpA